MGRPREVKDLEVDVMKTLLQYVTACEQDKPGAAKAILNMLAQDSIPARRIVDAVARLRKQSGEDAVRRVLAYVEGRVKQEARDAKAMSTE